MILFFIRLNFIWCMLHALNNIEYLDYTAVQIGPIKPTLIKGLPCDNHKDKVYGKTNNRDHSTLQSNR